MVAVKAYSDGQVFVPERPFKAEVNQEAIVTILDSKVSDAVGRASFADDTPRKNHSEVKKVLEGIENGTLSTPRVDSLLGIAAHLGDISLDEIREEWLKVFEMKILVDTNIVLDVVLKRRPFYGKSVAVFQCIDQRLVSG